MQKLVEQHGLPSIYGVWNPDVERIEYTIRDSDDLWVWDVMRRDCVALERAGWAVHPSFVLPNPYVKIKR